MQFICYYFPALRILVELGIEPAFLFGIDCWTTDQDTLAHCTSIYFGPFVLSIHH